MEECPICAFSYNKTKYKKIICKFCSKDACSNCMQQYILSMLEDGDPKCLYCKNIFTFEYLNQIFNKNFLNKKYRLKRIEYLYAREKSLFPLVMGKAKQLINFNNARKKYEKTMRDCDNQFINEYNKDNEEKLEHGYLFDVMVNEKFKHLLGKIKNRHNNNDNNNDDNNDTNTNNDNYDAHGNKIKKPIKIKTYKYNCSENNCNGMLDKNGVCALCNNKVCLKCLMPIKMHEKIKYNKIQDNKQNDEQNNEQDNEQNDEQYDKQDDKQNNKISKRDNFTIIEEIDDNTKEKVLYKCICKLNDIENANAIKKETRPCPKCNARIFKVDGCDQMFCTICHTAFSWKSGNIIVGHIHNPHYFDYLRNNNITEAHTDVRCDVLNDYIFSNKLNNINEFYKKYLLDVLRSKRHIQQVISANYIRKINNVDDLFFDLRLNHIIELFDIKNIKKDYEDKKNEIIKKYKYRLYKADLTLNKSREFLSVYTMIVQVLNDILLKVNNDIKNYEIYIEELSNFVKYADDVIKKTSDIYNRKLILLSTVISQPNRW